MPPSEDKAVLVAALANSATNGASTEFEAVTALIDAAVRVAGGDPDLISHLYSVLQDTQTDLDAL
jgi:hypothetical protein